MSCNQPARRLENAASRVTERFLAHFAARDWDAMAADCWPTTITDDDRRRVVNAGVRHGRDAAIADLRARAEIGVREHHVDHHCDPRRAPRPQSCPRLGSRSAARGFYAEALNVVEIDADERIAAHVVFDLDDIDAAFAELDARYLAGEAAAHAHTWSVIAEAYAAFNRHELPDDAGLGQRSTTGARPRSSPATMTAYIRDIVGPHAGPQHPRSRPCIG